MASTNTTAPEPKPLLLTYSPTGELSVDALADQVMQSLPAVERDRIAALQRLDKHLTRQSSKKEA